MNYIISYTCYNEFGVIIETRKVRAINKMSAVDAQCSLERFLKKRHVLFGRLLVHSCKEEATFNPLENFLSFFKR